MTPELKPHPLNSPSVVLFQERSCGRWFPLAGTCEDSARSGPGGDPRSCRDTHADGHTQRRADQRLVTLCCGTVRQTWTSYVRHRQPSHGPGEHTDLLMNCSRPARRSSMKESSKRPSSLRNGSCLFRALPGRDGTTI